MKSMYFVRTLLVSVESLVIFLGLATWILRPNWLNDAASAVRPNDELLKFLVLLPIGLLVWIANEIRSLLHDDKETTKLLIRWPQYWKLKIHVWISLLYAVIFMVLSTAPWVSGAGVTVAWGLLLFTGGTVGQLVVASGVYLARLRVKEYVAASN